MAEIPGLVRFVDIGGRNPTAGWRPVCPLKKLRERLSGGGSSSLSRSNASPRRPVIRTPQRCTVPSPGGALHHASQGNAGTGLA
jgi:hypothetical protein